MNENVKCPFCKSEDMRFISDFGFYEKFDKIDQEQNSLPLQPLIEGKIYYVGKYFCRNCGHVSELMSEDSLEEYKKDEIYFRKK